MVRIEVEESVLAGLSAQAERQGVSLKIYLEQLAGLRTWDNGNLSRLHGAELERLLDVESSGDSTYEGTYTRADIYRDHD